jgi:DNA-binding SARP family transcriptional activator/tetratricopeptide (TPR) repeat protein
LKTIEALGRRKDKTAVALRVGVLGPVTAWLDDREVSVGQPRQRALLALLASRANRVVSRDELVDAIWGSRAPVTAEGGIYTYVAGLRKILDPGRKPRDAGTVLVSTGAGYTLKLPPKGLDADEFESLLARARAHRAEGYLPGTERDLRTALGLWRGAALAGVPGPHAEAERHRLTELKLAAASEHAEVLIALGRAEEAIPELTVMIAEHPLREHARSMLMVALYRCGRQGDALAVYADARATLAAELGIEPGPELSRVHQQVLDMDQALSETSATIPTPRESPSARPVARSAGRSSEATESARTTVAAVASVVGDTSKTPGANGRQEANEIQAPAQLPLEIAGFTGRRLQLGRLESLLPGDDPKTVPVALITGMAGVGKTALAIRFARHAAPLFPDGQLYVNLRGFDPAAEPADSRSVLRGFLEALGVSGSRMPESVEARIGLFRSMVDGKRLLVVLDNAGSENQVRPLLPASPGCMVIITSRNQLTGMVAAEGAQPVPLEVLADDEATDLLRQRLQPEVVDGAPAAVAEIIRLCGRLPLALSVTAARAATQPRLTLPALARELRLTGAHLLEVGAEASTDIWAVFSWSYNQLSDPTARLFRLLGTHPGPDVSAAAAASMAGISLADTRKALAELTRASLLAEPTPGRFTYHDLLRAYAAELGSDQDGAAVVAAAEGRLLDHYLRSADTAVHRLHPAMPTLTLGDPVPGVTAEGFRSHEEALAWTRDELEVLLATMPLAARNSDHDIYCWQMPLLMSFLLERACRWHDNLAVHRIALVAAGRLDDQRAIGHAHSGLGRTYMRVGDHEAAREHLDQALEAFETAGDRNSQARVRSWLAVLLENQGKYAEGLQHAREALRLRRAFGNRAAIAHAENIAGWLYARLGQFDESVRHCRRALDMATETGSRVLAADVLDSLGLAYVGLGEPERALSYYQQALAAFRENGYVLGEFSALVGCGDAYLAAGDITAARIAWQQALAIGEGAITPSDAARVKEKLGAGGLASVVR